MTLRFLTNTAGDNASIMSFVDGATASGYDDYDAMSGPRSRMVRSAASSSAITLAHTFAANVDADYMVVSRADKLLTRSNMDTIIRNYGANLAWSDISATIVCPLPLASLIGVGSQDYVKSFTPDVKRGYALRVSTAGGDEEAMMISHLCFAKAFSFGVEPERPLAEEDLTAEELAVPLKSEEPYKISRRIRLNFKGVARAKVDEFLALPQVFNWPLYLYDDDDSDLALWEHQLEHVIVEGMTENWQARSDVDLWDIELRVARLKHYE